MKDKVKGKMKDKGQDEWQWTRVKGKGEGQDIVKMMKKFIILTVKGKGQCQRKR